MSNNLEVQDERETEKTYKKAYEAREYRALEDLARDEINRFLGKLSLKTGKE